MLASRASLLARTRARLPRLALPLSSSSSQRTDRRLTGGDIGSSARILAGIVALGGTAFGLSFLPSSPPSVAFADSDNLNPPQLADPVPEKKSKYLFGESYRRRVFFNYEKRIRMKSPPEKGFSTLLLGGIYGQIRPLHKEPIIHLHESS